MTEERKGTLEFIRSEYPALKERLGLAEKDLKDTQDAFDRQIKNKQNYWNSRIADFETEWNLDYMRSELQPLQSGLTEDVVRLNELDIQAKEAGERLKNLRADTRAFRVPRGLQGHNR